MRTFDVVLTGDVEVAAFLVMHVTYDFVETWANDVATSRAPTDSKE